MGDKLLKAGRVSTYFTSILSNHKNGGLRRSKAELLSISANRAQRTHYKYLLSADGNMDIDIAPEED